MIMIWILDKLERDIKQNIYNLKKAGFKDNADIIKKLKDLKKDAEALQRLNA
jgi:hypothetical protein